MLTLVNGIHSGYALCFITASLLSTLVAFCHPGLLLPQYRDWITRHCPSIRSPLLEYCLQVFSYLMPIVSIGGLLALCTTSGLSQIPTASLFFVGAIVWIIFALTASFRQSGYQLLFVSRLFAYLSMILLFCFLVTQLVAATHVGSYRRMGILFVGVSLLSIFLLNDDCDVSNGYYELIGDIRNKLEWKRQPLLIGAGIDFKIYWHTIRDKLNISQVNTIIWVISMCPLIAFVVFWHRKSEVGSSNAAVIAVVTQICAEAVQLSLSNSSDHLTVSKEIIREISIQRFVLVIAGEHYWLLALCANILYCSGKLVLLYLKALFPISKTSFISKIQKAISTKVFSVNMDIAAFAAANPGAGESSSATPPLQALSSAAPSATISPSDLLPLSPIDESNETNECEGEVQMTSAVVVVNADTASVGQSAAASVPVPWLLPTVTAFIALQPLFILQLLLWIVIIIAFKMSSGIQLLRVAGIRQTVWVCLIELLWFTAMGIYALRHVILRGGLDGNKIADDSVLAYAALVLDRVSDLSALQQHLDLLCQSFGASALSKSRQIGVLSFIVFIMIVGSACFASALTGWWIMVPCIILFPTAIFIFRNFLVSWVRDGYQIHFTIIRSAAAVGVALQWLSQISVCGVSLHWHSATKHSVRPSIIASSVTASVEEGRGGAVMSMAVLPTPIRASRKQAVAGLDPTPSTPAIAPELDITASPGPSLSAVQLSFEDCTEGNELRDGVDTRAAVPAVSPLPSPDAARAGNVTTRVVVLLRDLVSNCKPRKSCTIAFLILVLCSAISAVFDNWYCAVYTSLWLAGAGCTWATLLRWRSMIRVDTVMITLLLISWIFTVAWSILSGIRNSFGASSAISVVMILFAATASQMYMITLAIWHDLRQKKSVMVGMVAMLPPAQRDQQEHSLFVLHTIAQRFFIFASSLLLVCFILVAIYASAPWGIAMILLLVAAAVIIGVFSGIFSAPIISNNPHIVVVCASLLIVLCGLHGAVTDKSNAFWWSSLSWLSISCVALLHEVNQELFHTSHIRIFGRYLFPVLRESRDQDLPLVDESLKSTGGIIFLFMTWLWSIWSSVIVTQNDIGIVLFVMTSVLAGSYFNYCTRESLDHYVVFELSKRQCLQNCFWALTSNCNNNCKVDLNECQELNKGSSIDRMTDSEIRIVINKAVDRFVGTRNTLLEDFISLSKRVCIHELSAWPFVGLWYSIYNSELQFGADSGHCQQLMDSFELVVDRASRLDAMYARICIKMMTAAREAQRLNEAELLDFLRHCGISEFSNMTSETLKSVSSRDLAKTMHMYKIYQEKLANFKQSVKARAEVLAAAALRREQEQQRNLDEQKIRDDRKKWKESEPDRLLAEEEEREAQLILQKRMEVETRRQQLLLEETIRLQYEFDTAKHTALETERLYEEKRELEKELIRKQVVGEVEENKRIEAANKAEKRRLKEEAIRSQKERDLLDQRRKKEQAAMMARQQELAESIRRHHEEEVKRNAEAERQRQAAAVAMQVLQEAKNSEELHEADRLKQEAELQRRLEAQRLAAQEQARVDEAKQRDLQEMKSRQEALEAQALAAEQEQQKLLELLHSQQEQRREQEKLNKIKIEEERLERQRLRALEIESETRRVKELKDRLERERFEKKKKNLERLQQQKELDRLVEVNRQVERKGDDLQLFKDSEAESAVVDVKPPETGRIVSELPLEQFVTTCGLPINITLQERLAELSTIKNSRFTDPDFKGFSSLGSQVFINKAKDFKRICDLVPSVAESIDDHALPRAGAKPSDVRQGELGDCYFLSAISTIAERADLLKSIFPIARPNQSIYAVKLYFNGKFSVILVDDTFPCDKNGPLFAQCSVDGKPATSQHFWVMLLEKAYAKLHGSYAAIEGGFENQAMADLTGGIPKKFGALTKDSESKWRQLKTLCEQGHLLGAGSPPGSDVEISDLGIVQGHAYGILRVCEVDNYRLVCMRNPWGEKEWTGRWSDGSAEWTPRLAQLLDHHDSDDGVFWIAYEDFCRVFNTVYLCQVYDPAKYCIVAINGEWAPTTAGGCSNYLSFKSNPQFLLEASCDCSVTVVLSQLERPQAQGEGVTGPPVWNSVGINVLLLDGKPLTKRPTCKQELCGSSYSNIRDMTVEFEMSAKQKLTIIPCTFEQAKLGSFQLRCYAAHPATLALSQLVS